jgi:hypothetical protein
MNSALRLVALLALVVAVGACGGAPEAPVDSGVAGNVLIGPQCPVVQEGVPCPDAPYEASILVRDASGEVVATARSDKDGRFRINLAPGRYILEPSPGESGLPYAGPVTIDVRAHAFTPVTVSYDSGIR